MSVYDPNELFEWIVRKHSLDCHAFDIAYGVNDLNTVSVLIFDGSCGIKYYADSRLNQ